MKIPNGDPRAFLCEQGEGQEDPGEGSPYPTLRSSGAAAPSRPTETLGDDITNGDLLSLGCSLMNPAVPGLCLTNTVGGPKHSQTTDITTVWVVVPVSSGFAISDPFGLAPLNITDTALDFPFLRTRGPIHPVSLILLQTSLLFLALVRVTGTFAVRRALRTTLCPDGVSTNTRSTGLVFHGRTDSVLVKDGNPKPYRASRSQKKESTDRCCHLTFNQSPTSY